MVEFCDMAELLAFATYTCVFRVAGSKYLALECPSLMKSLQCRYEKTPSNVVEANQCWGGNAPIKGHP